MKFRVSTFSSNGFVSEKKIHWIKEFREQTGCGLKEAKDVADWIDRMMVGHRPSAMVIDTTKETQFRFLRDCALIEVGRCKMIQRIKPELTRPTAVVLLERTANRLIKLGDYEKARAVLKILVNAR